MVGRIRSPARRVGLLGVALFTLSVGVWAQSTHTVCSSGCDFTSIQNAVSFATSGDTVALLSGTFYETVGVDKSLTIRGSGPENTVVDGGGAQIVFGLGGSCELGGGVLSLELRDMTIRNGTTTGVSCNYVSCPPIPGKGLCPWSPARHLFVDNCVVQDNGAGIRLPSCSNCTVEIDSSTITGNHDGVVGNATIINSSIADNQTGVLGFANRPGWGGSDGCSCNPREGHIANSVISNNIIGVDTGYAITTTTISGNDTGILGMGYYDGPHAVSNTSVVGNSGDGVSGANPVITTSTISGNGGNGVSVYSYVDYGSTYGGVTIKDSTISSNGGSGLAEKRWPYGAPDAFRLERSIVADNSSGQCPAGQHVASEGYNLSSDNSCNLTQPTDMPSTDPLLLPLADNGGPTPTHALAPNSPAIDAAGLDCEAADQRGVPRPQDGDGDGIAECDIGAFEAETTGKVCICHFPPGNANEAKTVCVGAKAAFAHLAQHGDTLGECSD